MKCSDFLPHPTPPPPPSFFDTIYILVCTYLMFWSPGTLFPGKFSAAKENLSQSPKFTEQTSFVHKCFMRQTVHRHPEGVQKCQNLLPTAHLVQAGARASTGEQVLKLKNRDWTAGRTWFGWWHRYCTKPSFCLLLSTALLLVLIAGEYRKAGTLNNQHSQRDVSAQHRLKQSQDVPFPALTLGWFLDSDFFQAVFEKP